MTSGFGCKALQFSAVQALVSLERTCLPLRILGFVFSPASCFEQGLEMSTLKGLLVFQSVSFGLPFPFPSVALSLVHPTSRWVGGICLSTSLRICAVSVSLLSLLTGGTETGTVYDPCVLLTSLPDTLWCPVLFVLSVSCDSLVRLLLLAPVKTKVRVSPTNLSVAIKRALCVSQGATGPALHL